MSGINRYNSIQAIALNHIVRKREQTFDNYEYYTQILRDFVRMLKMQTKYGIEVMRGYATASTNGIIQLPERYVKYVAVGVSESGQFRTLTYDRSMIMDEIPKCDSLDTPVTDNSSGIMFPDYYWNGIHYPAMMCVGGGFNDAYFSEDRINKRIQVRPRLYSSEIIIYFVSTGDEINDSFPIPAPYVEVAHKWIDKVEVENSMDSNDYQKNEAKKRYDIAKMEARPLDSEMNFTRFVDIVNSASVKMKTIDPNGTG